MKRCIIAYNIVYPENRSAAADRSAVSRFLRVSDRLESICKIFLTENFYYRNFRDDVIHHEIFPTSEVKSFSEKKCKSTPNGLERVKKKSRPVRCSCRPVACIHKRVFGCVKVYKCLLPLL